MPSQDAGIDRLAQIRIVLDRTSHPGNIGSAARAMKVMGLTRLELVRPARFPDAQATALASSADDVLERAGVHDRLDAAIGDCALVLGTSDRNRSVAQPVLTPREAAARAFDEPGPVAIVFGTENSGMDNATLDRCHALVTIPTGSCYTSLNLAQAVQVIGYELQLAARAGAKTATATGTHRAAPARRMEVFFARLEQTLRAIGFSTPGQDDTLHRRLRRVYLRARPDDDELNILNGILSRTLRIAATDRRDDDPDTESKPD